MVIDTMVLTCSVRCPGAFTTTTGGPSVRQRPPWSRRCLALACAALVIMATVAQPTHAYIIVSGNIIKSYDARCEDVVVVGAITNVSLTIANPKSIWVQGSPRYLDRVTLTLHHNMSACATSPLLISSDGYWTLIASMLLLLNSSRSLVTFGASAQPLSLTSSSTLSVTGTSSILLYADLSSSSVRVSSSGGNESDPSQFDLSLTQSQFTVTNTGRHTVRFRLLNNSTATMLGLTSVGVPLTIAAARNAGFTSPYPGIVVEHLVAPAVVTFPYLTYEKCCYLENYRNCVYCYNVLTITGLDYVAKFTSLLQVTITATGATRIETLPSASISSSTIDGGGSSLGKLQTLHLSGPLTAYNSAFVLLSTTTISLISITFAAANVTMETAVSSMPQQCRTSNLTFSSGTILGGYLVNHLSIVGGPVHVVMGAGLTLAANVNVTSAASSSLSCGSRLDIANGTTITGATVSFIQSTLQSVTIHGTLVGATIAMHGAAIAFPNNLSSMVIRPIVSVTSTVVGSLTAAWGTVEVAASVVRWQRLVVSVVGSTCSSGTVVLPAIDVLSSGTLSVTGSFALTAMPKSRMGPSATLVLSTTCTLSTLTVSDADFADAASLSVIGWAAVSVRGARLNGTATVSIVSATATAVTVTDPTFGHASSIAGLVLGGSCVQATVAGTLLGVTVTLPSVQSLRVSDAHIVSGGAVHATACVSSASPVDIRSTSGTVISNGSLTILQSGSFDTGTVALSWREATAGARIAVTTSSANINTLLSAGLSLAEKSTCQLMLSAGNVTIGTGLAILSGAALTISSSSYSNDVRGVATVATGATFSITNTRHDDDVAAVLSLLHLNISRGAVVTLHGNGGSSCIGTAACTVRITGATWPRGSTLSVVAPSKFLGVSDVTGLSLVGPSRGKGLLLSGRMQDCTISVSTSGADENSTATNVVFAGTALSWTMQSAAAARTLLLSPGLVIYNRSVISLVATSCVACSPPITIAGGAVRNSSLSVQVPSSMYGTRLDGAALCATIAISAAGSITVNGPFAQGSNTTIVSLQRVRVEPAVITLDNASLSVHAPTVETANTPFAPVLLNHSTLSVASTTTTGMWLLDGRNVSASTVVLYIPKASATVSNLTRAGATFTITAASITSAGEWSGGVHATMVIPSGTLLNLSTIPEFRNISIALQLPTVDLVQPLLNRKMWFAALSIALPPFLEGGAPPLLVDGSRMYRSSVSLTMLGRAVHVSKLDIPGAANTVRASTRTATVAGATVCDAVVDLSVTESINFQPVLVSSASLSVTTSANSADDLVTLLGAISLYDGAATLVAAAPQLCRSAACRPLIVRAAHVIRSLVTIAALGSEVVVTGLGSMSALSVTCDTVRITGSYTNGSRVDVAANRTLQLTPSNISASAFNVSVADARASIIPLALPTRVYDSAVVLNIENWGSNCSIALCSDCSRSNISVASFCDNVTAGPMIDCTLRFEGGAPSAGLRVGLAALTRSDVHIHAGDDACVHIDALGANNTVFVGQLSALSLAGLWSTGSTLVATNLTTSLRIASSAVLNGVHAQVFAQVDRQLNVSLDGALVEGSVHVVESHTSDGAARRQTTSIASTPRYVLTMALLQNARLVVDGVQRWWAPGADAAAIHAACTFVDASPPQHGQTQKAVVSLVVSALVVAPSAISGNSKVVLTNVGVRLDPWAAGGSTLPPAPYPLSALGLSTMTADPSASGASYAFVGLLIAPALTTNHSCVAIGNMSVEVVDRPAASTTPLGTSHARLMALLVANTSIAPHHNVSVVLLSYGALALVGIEHITTGLETTALRSMAVFGVAAGLPGASINAVRFRPRLTVVGANETQTVNACTAGGSSTDAACTVARIVVQDTAVTMHSVAAGATATAGVAIFGFTNATVLAIAMINLSVALVPTTCHARNLPRDQAAMSPHHMAAVVIWDCNGTIVDVVLDRCAARNVSTALSIDGAHPRNITIKDTSIQQCVEAADNAATGPIGAVVDVRASTATKSDGSMPSISSDDALVLRRCVVSCDNPNVFNQTGSSVAVAIGPEAVALPIDVGTSHFDGCNVLAHSTSAAVVSEEQQSEGLASVLWACNNWSGRVQCPKAFVRTLVVQQRQHYALPVVSDRLGDAICRSGTVSPTETTDGTKSLSNSATPSTSAADTVSYSKSLSNSATPSTSAAATGSYSKSMSNSTTPSTSATATCSASSSPTNTLSPTGTATDSLTVSIDPCNTTFRGDSNDFVRQVTLLTDIGAGDFVFNATQATFLSINRVQLAAVRTIRLQFGFNTYLRNFYYNTSLAWFPLPHTVNCLSGGFELVNATDFIARIDYDPDVSLRTGVRQDYHCNLTFSSDIFQCQLMTNFSFNFSATILVSGTSNVISAAEAAAIDLTAAVVALVSSGAALLQQSRAAALAVLAQCQFSLVDELPAQESPLQLGFGSELQHFHRGCVVGNLLVVVGFTVAVLVVLLVAAGLCRRDIHILEWQVVDTTDPAPCTTAIADDPAGSTDQPVGDPALVDGLVHPAPHTAHNAQDASLLFASCTTDQEVAVVPLLCTDHLMPMDVGMESFAHDSHEAAFLYLQCYESVVAGADNVGTAATEVPPDATNNVDNGKHDATPVGTVSDGASERRDDADDLERLAQLPGRDSPVSEPKKPQQLVHVGTRRETFQEALRRMCGIVSYPSIALLPMGLLVDSTVCSSVRLLVHPVDQHDTLIGGGGVAVYGVLLMACVGYAVCGTTAVTETPSVRRMTNALTSRRRVRALLRYWLLPTVAVRAPQRRARHVFGMMRHLLDDSKYPAFICCDIALSILVAALVGVGISRRELCATLAAAGFGGCVLFFAAVLTMRPGFSRLNRCVNVAGSALGLLSSMLTLVSMHTDIVVLGTVNQWLSLCMIGLGLLQFVTTSIAILAWFQALLSVLLLRDGTNVGGAALTLILGTATLRSLSILRKDGDEVDSVASSVKDTESEEDEMESEEDEMNVEGLWENADDNSDKELSLLFSDDEGSFFALPDVPTHTCPLQEEPFHHGDSDLLQAFAAAPCVSLSTMFEQAGISHSLAIDDN